MKVGKPIQVHTPCARCKFKGRLWEVHGPSTWWTFCFNCRLYREWEAGKETKVVRMTPTESERREAKYLKTLKRKL